MKIQAVLMSATLAVASMAPALHAQSSEPIGTVNVPFAFETSSGQHFNPGVYNMTLENEHVVLLQGIAQGGLMMTRIEETRSDSGKPKATFHRYNNRYFLSDIALAGRNGHLCFTQSKAEKRLQLDASLIAPSNVELALLGSAH